MSWIREAGRKLRRKTMWRDRVEDDLCHLKARPLHLYWYANSSNFKLKFSYCYTDKTVPHTMQPPPQTETLRCMTPVTHRHSRIHTQNSIHTHIHTYRTARHTNMYIHTHILEERQWVLRATPQSPMITLNQSKRCEMRRWYILKLFYPVILNMVK